MDKRKFNGGHKKAGRKKGIGIAFDIQRHCQKLIEDMLSDDAIRMKATKQLSLLLETEEKEDYFYIIENNGLYKLGYSSNFAKRYKNYKCHLGDVNLIYLTKQKDCFNLETFCHNKFKDKRKTGEWFELNQNDLLYIIKYTSEIQITDLY